jgi:hypothetical protein
MNYINDISNIYFNLLEEGIEEKIPKLLNLVSNDIENKEEYIRWAAKTFDPTPQSSYITWILRMLKNKIIRGEEDSEKVKERLTQFEELKKKPQFPKDKKDINSYKTYGDLAETLDEFQGIKTKAEIKKTLTEEGIQYIDSSSGEEGVGYSLYIVTTSEAGAKHFRGTEWCVKDPKYFDGEYGPPYYYFTLDGAQHTLVHLESDQVMDVQDRDKELSSDEIDLMESEEITKYVLENDNGDNAIINYLRRVGDGYNGMIRDAFVGQIREAIDEYNEVLNIFTIDGDSLSYVDDPSDYRAYANGVISIDLSGAEEHLNDRDFRNIVSTVLDKEGIYGTVDEISEEGITISINDDDYSQGSVADKVRSFGDTLQNMEERFDMESFTENLMSKLGDGGYIYTDFHNFVNRVNLYEMEFQNFKNGRAHIAIDSEHFNDVFVILNDHSTIYEPNSFIFKLSKFLEPLLQNGLRIIMRNGGLDIAYDPEYELNKTFKEYMRELKTVKAFDKHFNYYKDRIKSFVKKYENLPQTKSDEASDQIPAIDMKSRKESPNQSTMELNEKVRRFDDLLNLINK